MNDLWERPPSELVDAMERAGIRRAILFTPPGEARMHASHPLLDPVARLISDDRRDYRAHEACFLEIGAESGHLLSAFVHWNHRGQAAGGVRFWRYDRLEDFVRDGLRLSIGMGRKCALAGLWWGGGKGVIARRDALDYDDRAAREAVFRDYGRFISGLRGCYVTAEDVGTRPEDMAVIHSRTRFTTCVPEAYGGSGNPSRLTASGVVVAAEAARAHLGKGDLRGTAVAMQGLGNVATFMIGELLERGVARIIAADLDEARVAAVRSQFPDAPLELRRAPSGDDSILAEPCDVLVPNAVGACLNARTIPTIQAEIVCGGANNQLEDPVEDARRLTQRDILYVPDFLANRMGIVNCANEQYGTLPDDPAVLAHLDRSEPKGIFRRCLEVFERAEASGHTTAEEARRLADELSLQPHPMWPGRSRQIIDSLIRGGWAS